MHRAERAFLRVFHQLCGPDAGQGSLLTWTRGMRV
jgi:hypothetical protein